MTDVGLHWIVIIRCDQNSVQVIRCSPFVLQDFFSIRADWNLKLFSASKERRKLNHGCLQSENIIRWTLKLTKVYDGRPASNGRTMNLTAREQKLFCWIKPKLLTASKCCRIRPASLRRLKPTGRVSGWGREKGKLRQDGRMRKTDGNFLWELWWSLNPDPCECSLSDWSGCGKTVKS